MRQPRRSLVVKTALGYIDSIANDAIHKPVFASDTSRPIAGQLMAQRLWFADAGEGVRNGVRYETLDALDDAFVGAVPVGKILLRLGSIENVKFRNVGQSQPRSLS